MSYWEILVIISIFISCSVCLDDSIHVKDVEKNDDDILENESADDIKMENEEGEDKDEEYNFYSFTVQDSEGKDVKLNKYMGKISLVVNVASECGYTDNHYSKLRQLHNHYSATGKFTVLAFPCNQFGRQEPGTDKEIQDFVHNKKKVKFPVFGKINVIDNDVPAAWQYLIDESGTAPSWNFFKYLVNEHGEVMDSWGPWISVDEIYPIVQEAVTNTLKRRHTEL